MKRNKILWKLSESYLDTYGPELRLWAAMLRTALRDARGTFASSDRLTASKRTQMANEARHWLESEDEHPQSFRWICETIGINWYEARVAARLVVEGSERVDVFPKWFLADPFGDIPIPDPGYDLSRRQTRKMSAAK